VLVLGIAYKRDVDDHRESPSLAIIQLLLSGGAVVEYNDPFFPEVGDLRHYSFSMRSTPLTPTLTELSAYDCVLIATDHSVYEYEKIVATSRLIIDTRNATRGLTSDKIVRC
jgi:UDP-N-acetyl-D-glucosamine dehydrogenase